MGARADNTQLCFLRELVMAKQAYDRSLQEFLSSVNRKVTPELEHCIEQLAKEDARELTVDQLVNVREAIK